MDQKCCWETDLSFEDNGTFPLAFEEGETFQTTMDQVVEVATSDHSKLKNRDMDNQHPISAITDLKTQLGRKMESSNALSNIDIQKIIGGI